MVTSTRRQKLQDKIALLTQQLEELTAKPAPFTRKSEGFPELLEQFNKVVDINNTDTITVLEALLKAKRTGLTLIKKS